MSDQHGVAETLSHLLVPLVELAPYAANAREHDDELIVSSLSELGQYRPIVVNKRDMTILAGNGTYAAAAELGWSHVAATYVDVDEQTARKIVLIDNRANDLAGYDDSLLAALLSELDGDFTATGFDSADLDKLLAEISRDGYGMGTQQPHEIEPFTRYSREQQIDAAVEHYSAVGFDTLLRARSVSAAAAMGQLDKLARTESDALLNSNLGYTVADSYHPHRFDVPISGKVTARQAFDDDKLLRRACGLILDDDGAITDSALLSTLGYVSGAQVAANFRPGFALLMYRAFCDQGEPVLDTSTGFGGRLCGFLASRCSEYVGIDPNVTTHNANERLAAALSQPDKTVTLINQPAEDVDVDDPRVGRDRFGFAFTSPPYFSKERYGETDDAADTSTQSWSRYTDGEAWRDGFLLPMLQLQYAALRAGAHNVVNIADVTIGKTTYPLVDWTIEQAQLVGFTHERTDRFPLSRVPGQGEQQARYEPLIVLRKPDVSLL